MKLFNPKTKQSITLVKVKLKRGHSKGEEVWEISEKTTLEQLGKFMGDEQRRIIKKLNTFIRPDQQWFKQPEKLVKHILLNTETFNLPEDLKDEVFK